MTSDLSWLWYLSAALLAALGLWIAYSALFKDQSRGRRRCPKCWYSMEGVPGTICPECGKDAKTEKRLLRTRRRWRVLAAAVSVLFLGFAAWNVPTLQRSGWLAIVPSTVLVLATDPLATGSTAPVLSGIPMVGRSFTNAAKTVPEQLNEETWSRAGGGRLWRWQSQIFISRCLSANEISPDSFIVAPSRWVLGQAMPVAPRRLRASPLTMFIVVELQESRGGWTSDTMIKLDPGADARVRISHAGIPLYETGVTPQTQWMKSAAELFDPVVGPETDALVLDALRPRIARDENGQLQVLVDDRRSRSVWDSIDFAVGYEIEIRIDDRPVARGRAYSNWGYKVWKYWQAVHLSAPVAAPADPTRVTLVIRSDADMAMKAYGQYPIGKQTRAWRGELHASPDAYTPPESDSQDP